jgi:hypothetical protein
MVAVLVPGLGVDRISDMLCNILKRRFLGYTQKICQDLSVPVKEMVVTNTGWSPANCRWKSTKETLPASPVFNGAVLLTPERFLKDIPRVTAEGFWTWAEVNEGAILRYELNYDLGQSLTRTQKAQRGRQLARRAPAILEEYVVAAGVDASPYDVEGDPKGLVRWEEEGIEIAKASTAPAPPITQEDFEQWLIELAMTFKSAVEDNELWRALWSHGQTRPQREEIAQVIARATWIQHCRASNIDITREAECGRGPVDFKFAQGWGMRALLEVKHISSSQFTHGADTQLPIYLKGESAPFGIYLCIGHSDRDFEEKRLARVRDACEAITSQGTTRIIPIFVDARRPKSASKA